MTAPGPGAGLKAAELTGRRTLIMGEVNTGKTTLLGRLLAELAAQGREGLVVVDLAPEAVGGVGGKMKLPAAEGLRVYSPTLAAPRLSGGSPREVEALAQANGRRIEEVFAAYLADPGQVLFINDVSLYLQSREPEGLWPVLEATPTVVMNGYYGRSLGRDPFSRRERERMERLRRYCHRVVLL